MKKWIPILISALLVTGCKEKLDDSSTVAGQEEPEILEKRGGEIIPVYDFSGLEEVLFSKENDTTYVVNFWATWCKPCIKELPYFEQLGANYSQQKVKVVLVSLDFPEYLEKKVIPFVKERELSSQVVLLDDPDANTWIRKVHPDWQGSIPATLMFNKRQKQFFEKEFTYQELQKEVESIL